MFANDKSIDNLESLFKEVRKYIELQGQFACRIWDGKVNPIIFKTFFHTFLKTELNLPRHVRDEVLTRSC